MKVAIAALLIACFAAATAAQALKCRVCGQAIKSEYYRVEDKSEDSKVEICRDCVNLESRCFACGLPVKSGYTTLTDGRYLCTRDAQEAVLEEDAAQKVCEQVKDELDRLFYRFLTLPGTNVVLTIVDRFHLESLFKSPGYQQRCTSIFGATQTREISNNVYVHSISVLSALKKPRLMAVCAHEYAHAWLGENLRPERKAALAHETVEAFCELMAYKLMEQRREEFEKKVIKTSPYTRGQIDALLAAENRHGFNAVLDWMKSGEEDKLAADNPDAIRSVRAKEPSPAPATIAFAGPVPLSIPDTLMLKGLSGPANRRLALINDHTFGLMEVGKVRLAQTNLTVKCLEIRTNSVLIQAEGSAELQELFLPTK